MRLIILLILVLLKSALPAAGQTFNNRYKFDPYSSGVGFSVEQLDNSLVIYSTFDDTLKKIGVQFLDIYGILSTEKKIGRDSNWLYVGYSNSTDIAFDHIVSAGSNKPFSNSISKGHLISWTSGNDTLQTSTFQSTEGDSMIIFVQAKTVEDGFVAVGSTRDGIGTENIILLKTDFDLNEVWRRSYGSTVAPHAGYSVVQTPDGGFLLGGVRKVPNSWDHCVVKTDAQGMQEDIGYYGTGYEGLFAHVANTADGNYMFGGMKKTGDDDYQSMICKLDTNLETLWCNTYNSPGPDCYVNSLKLLPDGNFIACGVDRSNYTMFGYILKIDPDGNIIWKRKYAQTEDNWCYLNDVILTSDGGYFLTGSLAPDFDLGLTQDIWGLKVDSYGCLVPGCQNNEWQEPPHLLDSALNASGTNATFGFSIYPNPTSQFVNVFVGLTPALSKAEGVRFELIDMQGRMVKSFSPQLTDATYMLDVEDLPAGVYLLKLLVDEEVVTTEKIMKK